MAPSSAEQDARESENDWLFLEPWFRFLHGYTHFSNSDGVEDSHAVRIGRAVDDVPFIRVGIDRELLQDDDEDADEENESDDEDAEDRDGEEARQQRVLRGEPLRLRLLREALVATSFLFKADYEIWFKFMCKWADFSLADHVIPIGSNTPVRAALQFKLELNTDHDLEYLDWSSSMIGGLLGTDDYSTDYTVCLAQVQRLMETRYGIVWEQIEPIRVKLCLTLEGFSISTFETSQRLLRLVDVIQQSQQLETRAREDGTCLGTLFTIVELSIDLMNVFVLHEHVVDALLTVLRQGVPVAWLRLPQ